MSHGPTDEQFALAERTDKALQAHYGCPFCFAGVEDGCITPAPYDGNRWWSQRTCERCGFSWLTVTPAMVELEHRHAMGQPD